MDPVRRAEEEARHQAILEITPLFSRARDRQRALGLLFGRRMRCCSLLAAHFFFFAAVFFAPYEWLTNVFIAAGFALIFYYY